MSWLHRILGKDGASQLAVDPTHFAARMSGRPMELGARGSYVLAVASGVMAAGLGGASEIFTARWTDATRYMILRSLALQAAQGTTAFAAGTAIFTANISRSYSANPAAQTAVVFSTTGGNKKRNAFPLSLFTDTGVMISATGAITPGTQTRDANPFAQVMSFLSSAATSVPNSFILPPGTFLWVRSGHEEYPILLVQNEGISIRATVPATGTWQFAVQMEWDEIDPAVVSGW